MIKKILWVIVACLILIFVALWVLSGGIGKAWNQASSFTNFVDFIFYNGTSTGYALRLPWQPEFPTGLGFSYEPSANNSVKQAQAEDALASLDQEYDTLNAQVAGAKTFGSPSPLAGQVRIVSEGNAREASAGAEYVEIAARSQNTSPVNLAGWSLQSAYTGMRAYIPPAAASFLMGAVNSVAPIQLAPGQSAILNSGVSPVGVSFRENICSGYLGQMQSFTPTLPNDCPSPASVLPMTPDNLKNYGQTCFDFIPSLSACEAPLNNFPAGVSQNCRAFAQDNFSYNGCVPQNRYRSSFLRDVWRVFLNGKTGLWQDGHDIIRLLDSEGRTVDVLTY